MDLDTYIVTVFDRIDDTTRLVVASLDLGRLRQRGPQPILADSEILTIETVGAYLGFTEEKTIYDYFRRHYAHFFPGLRRIDRSTFVRQVANLWRLKEAVWQHLLEHEVPVPEYVIADSLPIEVCRFARAPRCKRFRGEAAFGWCWVNDHVFYGFRFHALVDPFGFIRCFVVTPANVDEKEALEQMVDGKTGRVLGDRNYWSPAWMRWLLDRGVQVIAPFKHASRDPDRRWSAFLGRLRRRVETVFGQFTERFKMKQVGAKDTWHFASRLLRSVLSHTLALIVYRSSGGTDMQIANLLSA